VPGAPHLVTIGALLPMTGSAADYGNLMKRGIDVAVDDAARTGGADCKVIIEDSKSNPRDGYAGFLKLISADKAPVVMPVLSNIILAVVPTATEKNIALLNCPANSPKLRGASPSFFNLIPLSDRESQDIAAFARTQFKARRLALVFVNNDSGRGYRDNVDKSFRLTGGAVVASEGHDQGTTDFRSTVLRIKQARPDCIFMATYYAESALFLRQSKAAGLNPHWLSYSSVETPEFLKLAGDAAEGLAYSQPGIDIDAQDSLTKNFVDRYKVRYGGPPDLWAAQFYDGTRLLYAAVKSGARTGQQIATFLTGVRDFPGVTGPITFDKDRCVSRQVRFKQVHDGRFAPYDSH